MAKEKSYAGSQSGEQRGAQDVREAAGGGKRGKRKGWAPGQPVMLVTERFVLRSVSPDRVTPDYLNWLKDPELMMFLNLRPRQEDTPESMLERMRAYVAKSNNRTSFHLGVFPRSDEPRKLKPQIGFFVLDLDFKNGTAQTRVVIGDHDYWGKHVVREAGTAIIEFVFRSTNFVKVWGATSSRNIPSIYNYKALGFDCEGILKDHIQGLDGKRMDVLMFGFSRGKWMTRKEAGK